MLSQITSHYKSPKSQGLALACAGRAGNSRRRGRTRRRLSCTFGWIMTDFKDVAPRGDFQPVWILKDGCVSLYFYCQHDIYSSAPLGCSLKPIICLQQTLQICCEQLTSPPLSLHTGISPLLLYYSPSCLHVQVASLAKSCLWCPDSSWWLPKRSSTFLPLLLSAVFV